MLWFIVYLLHLAHAPPLGESLNYSKHCDYYEPKVGALAAKASSALCFISHKVSRKLDGKRGTRKTVSVSLASLFNHHGFSRL